MTSAVDDEICRGTRTGRCAALVRQLAAVTGPLRSTELIYCWDPDGPNDPRAPHRPLITSARFDPASGDTIITAALDKPADLVRHETLFFFANAALDASGRAEAETFIESAPVRGQAAELRVHADLRGKYIAAFDSAFFDYFGEATWSEVSELSDGVQVF